MDKKLYVCFVNMEKAFDRVPRKVIKWSLKVLLKTVMSLYKGITKSLGYIKIIKKIFL